MPPAGVAVTLFGGCWGAGVVGGGTGLGEAQESAATTRPVERTAVIRRWFRCTTNFLGRSEGVRTATLYRFVARPIRSLEWFSGPAGCCEGRASATDEPERDLASHPPQRQGDPEQSEMLELARPREGSRVHRLEAEHCGERRRDSLRVRVVAGEE